MVIVLDDGLWAATQLDRACPEEHSHGRLPVPTKASSEQRISPRPLARTVAVHMDPNGPSYVDPPEFAPTVLYLAEGQPVSYDDRRGGDESDNDSTLDGIEFVDMPEPEPPASQRSGIVRLGLRLVDRFRRDPQWRTMVLVYAAELACIVLVVLKGFDSQLFGVDPDDAKCPRETICTEEWFEVMLLTMSRISGYAMYPPLILPFATKCHVVNGRLQLTRLSQFFPFNDLQTLHRHMGYHLMVLTPIHGICHIVRWLLDDEGHLLLTASSLTGFVGWAALLLVCVPMMHRVRDTFLWGMRKTLHYFFIVFGIAVALHAPATSIGWIMLTAMLLYALDVVLALFLQTHQVDDPQWTVLGKSVVLRFRDPPHFTGRWGYIQVCDPRVRRSQHPVAVYPDFEEAGYSCAHIQGVGKDRSWTKRLQRSLQLEEGLLQSTSHPIWIQGPIPTPYDAAGDHENALFFCTGIGITSALAPIYRTLHRGSVHLVWSCRDLGQILMHLPAIGRNARALNFIFYTGDEPTEDVVCPRHTWIIRSRCPNLKVITYIVLRREKPKNRAVRLALRNHLHAMQHPSASSDAPAPAAPPLSSDPATPLHAVSSGEASLPPDGSPAADSHPMPRL